MALIYASGPGPPLVPLQGGGGAPRFFPAPEFPHPDPSPVSIFTTNALTEWSVRANLVAHEERLVGSTSERAGHIASLVICEENP